MNKKVIFFGGDGGCLDSYYLCLENYKLSKSIILNDGQIKLPKKTEYGGGFSTIESGRYKYYNFVYQCGNSKNHKKRYKRKLVFLGFPLIGPFKGLSPCLK